MKPATCKDITSIAALVADKEFLVSYWSVLRKEKRAFYSTQIGQSVAEGICNVTVFHERTPTDSCHSCP